MHVYSRRLVSALTLPPINESWLTDMYYIGDTTFVNVAASTGDFLSSMMRAFLTSLISN